MSSPLIATVPNAKFMKARVDFSVPELPAE